MYIVDYHTHTNYSPDSDAPFETMIKAAIDKGVNEFCVTDHIDNPELYFFDLPNYSKFLEEFNIFKEKYKNSIKLLFGAELSLAPYLKEEVEKIMPLQDYDFVIGSSHETEKKFLFSRTTYYDGKSKEEAFRIYFEEVLENIKIFDEYDVYGHFDYIYRYSKYADNSFNYFDYKDIIDECLKILVSKGKGLEVNASGFKYQLNSFHPSLDILKTYKNLGGEIITYGSDSHEPFYIVNKYKEAMEYIKSAGFQYITTFEKRKLKQIKID